MPDIWELASTLVKFLLFLGVLGSTGLVLVRIVFAREMRGLHATMVRQATAFAVLALLAAGAGFALKGAAMTGALSGMTDPEMLGLLWQTPAGTAFAYRIAGLGLVLLGRRQRRSACRSPLPAAWRCCGRFPGSGMSPTWGRFGSKYCFSCISPAAPSGSASSCRSARLPGTAKISSSQLAWGTASVASPPLQYRS